MNALYLLNPRGISEAVIEEVKVVPGLELTVNGDWERLSPEELAELIRGYDILLLSRGPRLPDELAEKPGRLKYISYLHGSIRHLIGLPIVRSNIQITNWGDSPALGLAETSLALLYACLKDLYRRIMEVRNGERCVIRSVGGTLRGLRVGIYGCGFAGREFVRLILPLGANIRIFDPYITEIPDSCVRVDSLKELFAWSQAVAVHAGLTPETEKTITAGLLSLLPDQGILINTARGAIFDQDALFSELKSGRLRAGLDVLDPDDLPPDHEARKWENLIWTCHTGSNSKPWANDGTLSRRDEILLENLRAFVEGRPLNYVIDEKRYSLMT